MTDEREGTQAPHVPEAAAAISSAPDDTVGDGLTAPTVDRSRPGWKDLAVVLAIVWAMEVGFAALTFAVLYVASGFQLPDPRIEYFLPAMTLSWIGTLATIWYVGCRKYRRPIRQTFALRSVARRTLVLSLLLGVACAVVGGTVAVIFADDEEPAIMKVAFNEPLEEGGEPVPSLIFVAVVLSLPILEEAYYRGFLYSVLNGLVGTIGACVIVVLWFGLIHAPQIGGNVAGVIVITCVGALLTYLRYRYDSLIPAAIAHVSYNATIALIGAIGSAVS